MEEDRYCPTCNIHLKYSYEDRAKNCYFISCFADRASIERKLEKAQTELEELKVVIEKEKEVKE